MPHCLVRQADRIQNGCAASPMIGAHERATMSGDCDIQIEAMPHAAMTSCSITATPSLSPDAAYQARQAAKRLACR